MFFDEAELEALRQRSFDSLLSSPAPEREMLKWFHAHESPDGLPVAQWLELVLPVANAIADPRIEPWLEHHILPFMQEAFTVRWRRFEHSSGEVRRALDAFVKWLESLPDDKVFRFCWDLLAYDRTFTPEPVWWLKHSGRLSGAISYDSLHVAVELAAEADAMFWWHPDRWSVVNWESASAPYIALLNHPSYLVRGAASLVLGRLFHGVKTRGNRETAPPVSTMLSLVQGWETGTAGVAGAFLHGANWDVEPEARKLFNDGFDIKAWFMETLRVSSREPEVPHILTLEFYAHELFASDESAIREFLKMGRRELAVMTAEEAEGNAAAEGESKSQGCNTSD